MNYKAVMGYNITLDQAIKQGGFYSPTGIWNSLLRMDGLILRGRVETLIIKKDMQQVFMHITDFNKKQYRIPGGSFEKDVPNYIQAKNECNEEARIQIKNPLNTGIHYIKKYKNPDKITGVRKELRWVGNYTEVYVAEYDGPYVGHIDKEDRDDEMYTNGKFYKLSEVYDILSEPHKKVIDDIFPVIKSGEIDKSSNILYTNDYDNSDIHYFPYYTPTEMAKTGVHNEEKNHDANVDDDAIDWYHEYRDTLHNPDSENWLKEVKYRHENYLLEPSTINRQLLLNIGWNPSVVPSIENVLIASKRTEKRLNEETKKHDDGIIPIMESLIFSQKDIVKNMDDFENGKSNILFITGLSGSGKTTMADEICEEYGATKLSLDYFQNYNYISSNSNFRNTIISSNNGDIPLMLKLIDEYMDSHKEAKEKSQEFGDIDLVTFKDYFIPFFNWLISKFKKTKERYVVEGLHILLYIRYKDISKYPLICINTSMTKSIIRKWVRDQWTTKDIIKYGMNDMVSFKRWNDQYNTFKRSMNESVNMFPIDEGYIKSTDNLEFNMDKWSNKGDHNILYITGISGSGKTTLSKDIAKKYKAEYIELDKFTLGIVKGLNIWFDKVNDGTYEVHPLLIEYFNSINDINTTKSWTNPDVGNEHNKFMKWLIDRIKGDGNLYIVEGAQFFMKLSDIDPVLIKGEPLIVVGTSAMKSWLRRLRRDTQNDETVSRFIYHLKKDVPMLFKYYISNEKDLQDFVRTISESANAFSTNEGYIKSDNDIYYNKDKFEYKAIKDIETFHKDMKDAMGVYNKDDHKYTKAIIDNGKTIGYIGFSTYNIDGKKYLGIGNFMIVKKYQRSGYGQKVIKDIISSNKKEYDEIYCYVDKDNKNAISFYKKIGKVSDTVNKNDQYYVTLYSKGGFLNEMKRSELDDSEFGLPELRKYPMPDKDHVLSAIKFFNYVSPANEKELARNIKKKMKQYGISPDHVGEKNRIKKYLKEDTDLLEYGLVFNNFDNTKPALVFDLGGVFIECEESIKDKLYKNRQIPNDLVEELDSYIGNTYWTNKDKLEYASSDEYTRFMINNAPDHLKRYISIWLKEDLNDSSIKLFNYTIDLLKELKKKNYRLYYISNWTKYSRDILKKKGLFNFLDEYFDGGIFSGDVGYMKPDINIFQWFFDTYHEVKPNDCVFFDDKYENIQAAMKIGMYGILFNSLYTPQWIYDNFCSGE